MTRYLAWSLLRAGLSGQRTWTPAWRDAKPKKSYEAVIIGGGGHGLATAYYLASKHGLRDIAVLERGWIGGGNTGRNTTVIRSNSFFPESTRFYDFSLSLYEGLSRELNYNIMFSRRGMCLPALEHTAAGLPATTTAPQPGEGWVTSSTSDTPAFLLIADQSYAGYLLHLLGSPS